MVIKDKHSGRTIKLQGTPDGDALLSAIDWLAAGSVAGGDK
ncbi:DSBA oxidoreductase [Pseudomonas syringae pv. viburni]|uniref:DSBA oxidoreductase n=1 Tax=Pseudomonas syringae pv. viburni TaxID=251703 RepID=A0A0Q0F4G7_9PSED|nr:DSBA oxidoreductase [Pseudomonas syringae pv. viburni]